jgi:hypothetical protein
MSITITIPDADLRLRATRAYNTQCETAIAANKEAATLRETRAKLLLEDLLRNILDLKVDLRRMVVDGGHVRITLDSGMTFLVDLVTDPDILLYQESCSKCHGLNTGGRPHPEIRRERIGSLAELGALLDKPFTCCFCAADGARRKAVAR